MMNSLRSFLMTNSAFSSALIATCVAGAGYYQWSHAKEKEHPRKFQEMVFKSLENSIFYPCKIDAAYKLAGLYPNDRGDVGLFLTTIKGHTHYQVSKNMKENHMRFLLQRFSETPGEFDKDFLKYPHLNCFLNPHMTLLDISLARDRHEDLVEYEITNYEGEMRPAPGEIMLAMVNGTLYKIFEIQGVRVKQQFSNGDKKRLQGSHRAGFVPQNLNAEYILQQQGYINNLQTIQIILRQLLRPYLSVSEISENEVKPSRKLHCCLRVQLMKLGYIKKFKPKYNNLAAIDLKLEKLGIVKGKLMRHRFNYVIENCEELESTSITSLKSAPPGFVAGTPTETTNSIEEHTKFYCIQREREVTFDLKKRVKYGTENLTMEEKYKVFENWVTAKIRRKNRYLLKRDKMLTKYYLTFELFSEYLQNATLIPKRFWKILKFIRGELNRTNKQLLPIFDRYNQKGKTTRETLSGKKWYYMPTRMTEVFIELKRKKRVFRNMIYTAVAKVVHTRTDLNTTKKNRRNLNFRGLERVEAVHEFSTYSGTNELLTGVHISLDDVMKNKEDLEKIQTSLISSPLRSMHLTMPLFKLIGDDDLTLITTRKESFLIEEAIRMSTRETHYQVNSSTFDFVKKRAKLI